MGAILFPWQMICIGHPLGHGEHEYDGPSPCEIWEAYDGEETALLPPMHCGQVSADIDDFQIPQSERISVENIVVVAVLFDLVKLPQTKTPYSPLPEIRCNTGPPLLSDSPLRAPPFI